MALDSRAAAALALHRFGLGPRPGSIAAIASDPRGALLAEIGRPDAAQIAKGDLLTSAQAARAAYEDRAARQARQTVAQRAQKEAERRRAMAAETGDAMEAKADAAMETPAAPKPQAEVRPEPPLAQQILRKEAKARIDAALGAEIGFAERLAWFWSNHFCINADKVPAMAGGYEREAIRPHVLGRFADMLKAVESHPAMLFYLDNAQSFGPHSPAGQRGRRGLNENLAREILELHTLGVNGGYTQADVTALARIITGWTFAGREGRIGEPGTFVFFAMAHEPGAHTVLGKTYPAGGMEQGDAVLADLARHPATAQHIATKLARHFVADAPPRGLIDRLATVFRDTDGDLKAVATALIDWDEAWSAPLAKMRTPEEFLLASMRAIDRIPEEPGAILGPLYTMGMPLWQPPGPNGWPDTEAAWASPEGMKLRLDVAAAIAGRVKDLINPSELLDTVAGEAASAETRQAVARGESRQQGLGLLLMSPEFQRR
jgi:uncharacterized protein (DUF1800 family)